MKLLLHTCCGPCFLGVWEDLQDKNLEITNYYYNPNIYPENEYKKRLENLKIATCGKTNGVIEAEYKPAEHAKMVVGHENDFPGRCVHCYRLRLEKTAKFAKENGFDAFSTTLLVSPYQQHEVLKQTGEELAKQFGVKFYYKDFRPYYRPGQEMAKIIPIYRQKYCGCKYSLHPQK
jgi:predicted adenine nucleotide alpha hydrolase (AANH) superfamily ATPase